MALDNRIAHRHAVLNGHEYHYLFAEPTAEPKATVFLIHGWPDLAYGWRFQIPALLDLGLRVVAPDLMGFGGTAAPKSPPEDLASYSLKRASDDFAELARQLGIPKIIVGGHDWGGFVVYRFAMWHPDLVTAVFSVCTPYQPPTKSFVSLDMVVDRAPQFGYQKHLAGPEVERAIDSPERIRQLLNGMYGGRGPAKETTFTPEKGILFDNLPKVGKTPLLSDEEMDYYVSEYSRHGMHGTLNWYRTRQVNWREEQDLNTSKINVPVLFVQANKDNVLLPSLSKGMEKDIPNLSRREVNAGHWALWQAKDEVNSILRGWLQELAWQQDKSRL